jgi:hypothetical protein
VAIKCGETVRMAMEIIKKKKKENRRSFVTLRHESYCIAASPEIRHIPSIVPVSEEDCRLVRYEA